MEKSIIRWNEVPILNKITILGMIISIYLVKPMIFGANGTPIAMVLLFILTVAQLSCEKKVNINKRSIFIIASIVMLFIYELAQSIFLLGYFNIDIIKGLITTVFITFCYSILFENKVNKFYFFKIYIITLVFFCISAIITFVLSMFIDVFQLRILRYNISRYGYNFDIHFPLTPTTGWAKFGSIKVVRLSAMYRECGIAQMVYLWAFIVCDKYFYKHKNIKILLIVGAILCFSSVGYINLIILFGIYIILNINKFKITQSITLIVILMSFIWGFYNIDGVKLEDKAQVSYDARVDKAFEGLHEFSKKPILGTGYSNPYIEGTSTSLIQRLYTMGGIGLIIYLNIYVVGLRTTLNKKNYILGILPAFITCITSQPIWQDPIIFMLILYDYDSIYHKYKRKVKLN